MAGSRDARILGRSIPYEESHMEIINLPPHLDRPKQHARPATDTPTPSWEVVLRLLRWRLHQAGLRPPPCRRAEARPDLSLGRMRRTVGELG